MNAACVLALLFSVILLVIYFVISDGFAYFGRFRFQLFPSDWGIMAGDLGCIVRVGHIKAMDMVHITITCFFSREGKSEERGGRKGGEGKDEEGKQKGEKEERGNKK